VDALDFARMTDTDPKAEAARLKALRAMSPARRLGLAIGWSRSVRELNRAALQRQYPELAERRINRLLADKLLGPEIAAKAYGTVRTDG